MSRPVNAQVVEALIAEGAQPHVVYAYCTTGLLVTNHTAKQVSARDRKVWTAALSEFARLEVEGENKATN
jgi:hypothetical protein